MVFYWVFFFGGGGGNTKKLLPFSYCTFFSLFESFGILLKTILWIFLYCVWITPCITPSLPSTWSWYLSYNTGRDKLRRTPVQKVIEILKQRNANKDWTCKTYSSIELTDIDQSQKVEQTTNVRYYPQYTNNLIHQVHINKCQHKILYSKCLNSSIHMNMCSNKKGVLKVCVLLFGIRKMLLHYLTF